MATHSSILSWKTPWTEEPDRPHSPWGHKESGTSEPLYFTLVAQQERIRQQCRRPGFIPQVGKIPWRRAGYSCLENPRDREAWWATVHRIAQSQTQLSTAQHRLLLVIYFICVCVCTFSHVQIVATPLTAACQGPLSVEFLQSCPYVNPNLPIYTSRPYPLVTISLFSTSVTLLQFCKLIYTLLLAPQYNVILVFLCLTYFTYLTYFSQVHLYCCKQHFL